ncbi:unnamed protein product [Urochloa humidicola]
MQLCPTPTGGSPPSLPPLSLHLSSLRRRSLPHPCCAGLHRARLRARRWEQLRPRAGSRAGGRRRREGKARRQGLVAVARSSTAAGPCGRGGRRRRPELRHDRREAQGRDAAVGIAGRAGSRAVRDRNPRQPAVTPGKRARGGGARSAPHAVDSARRRSSFAGRARDSPDARELRRAISAGRSASSVPGGSSAGRARGVRQRRAPARRRRLLPLLHSDMSASAELEGAATARSASGLPPAAARPPPPPVCLASRRPLTGTAARPMPPAVLCVSVCSTASLLMRPRSGGGLAREKG